MVLLTKLLCWKGLGCAEYPVYLACTFAVNTETPKNLQWVCYTYSPRSLSFFYGGRPDHEHLRRQNLSQHNSRTAAYNCIQDGNTDPTESQNPTQFDLTTIFLLFILLVNLAFFIEGIFFSIESSDSNYN